MNAAPKLAQELIEIALDKGNKACSRIQAISEVFKIIDTNVVATEQRRQLQTIRQQLQTLEEGTVQPQAMGV